ncbi:hypothetical protein TNCV_1859321 [Trichonephila clavipes]|nr:hypothetical protein TNCV_1859321 [Trichonephila clavipes]
MFADDTAIITQNKRFSVVISNLQHYVSLLELWLTDWKIKVNASKSACLMFTRRPRLPVGLTPSKFLANPSPGTNHVNTGDAASVTPASGKWHETYGVPVPERGVPPHQNFRIKGRNSDFT